MVRSRLPVPSLLRPFGALLMLSPELLMRSAGYIFDVPHDDPDGQRILACGMELFNRKRVDSANYFKVLQVLKAELKTNYPGEYRFTVELVKTRCRKRAGWKMIYKRIQKCRQLPNQEILNYYLVVLPNRCPTK